MLFDYLAAMTIGTKRVLLGILAMLLVGFFWPYETGSTLKAPDRLAHSPVIESSLLADVDPNTFARQTAQQSAHPAAGITATLVQVNAVLGEVVGKMVYGSPDINPIEFRLSRHQRGASIRLPPGPATLELQDGWTSIPVKIDGDRDICIRLFSPAAYRFHFTMDGFPLASAAATFLVGGDYKWSGTTNEVGVIAPPPFPPGPVHFLLQGSDYCISDSYPYGLGGVRLEQFFDFNSEDLLAQASLTFVDASTGSPIEDAGLQWGECVIIGPNSDSLGTLRVPRRTAGIDVLEAIAPDYLPSLVSLSEDPALIRMQPLNELTVSVRTLAEAKISGARCFAIPADYDGNLTHLAPFYVGMTDDQGQCRMHTPQGEGVVALVIHPDFGSGMTRIAAENTRSASSAEVVLSQSPLTLGAGELSAEALTIEAKSITGDRISWSINDRGEIVFADAKIIATIAVQSEQTRTHLSRTPLLNNITALNAADLEASLSGHLELELEPTQAVRGRVIDGKGTPQPWLPFRLTRVAFHGVRDNLKAYPGLQGASPSALPGWVYDNQEAFVQGVSDGQGNFSMSQVPAGEYAVHFEDPGRGASSVLFGMIGYQSSVHIPLAGALEIEIPSRGFLDIITTDLETGAVIDKPVLEITYDKFTRSQLRVMRREFFGEDIRIWVSWKPEVVARVCAVGYAPQLIDLELLTSLEQPAKIMLRPIPAMKLDFSKTSLFQPEFEVVFLRPSLAGEYREVLGTLRLSNQHNEVVKVTAPIPECVLSIREVVNVNHSGPLTMIETSFTPGVTYVVPNEQQ